VTLTLDLSHLHDFQRDFLTRTEPYQLFSGGAGIGKSEVGVIKMIAYACNHPKSRVLYASSTWGTTKTVFLPLLIRALERFPQWMWQHEKGLNQFQLWNGSIIYYRNLANPASLRSLNLDMVLLEEATLIPHIEEVFAECERGLRNKKGPPQLIFITNPGLKSHFLHGFFFEKPAPDKWGVSLPARAGSAHQPDDYMRRLEALPASFRESLLEGKWGVREGAAFPTIDIRALPDTEEQSLRWALTFDYGFSPDPMVYLLCGLTKGRLYVKKELVLYSHPTWEHPKFLKPWFDDHNIIAYTGETATGAGETNSMIRKEFHIGHRITNKDRTWGWNRLSDMALAGILVIHPDCIETIKSLQSLTWIAGGKGIDVEGDYDDPADALRYMPMSSLGAIITSTGHGVTFTPLK
jgi:hypothetical protein